MKRSQLEYILPSENIANEPSEPRDQAKLLLLNRDTGQCKHTHFTDLPNILTRNDVLVLNETKVFPARLFSGKIEILLLQEMSDHSWRAMHRGKVRVGQPLQFGSIEAHVVKKQDYEITVDFHAEREDILEYIETHGQTPLPPYIKSSEDEQSLRRAYQTVFAKHTGSVAAPTAGLHFTRSLLERLQESGVYVEYVTLHVGAGTFLPIKEDDITKHSMHSEYFSIQPETLARLNEYKLSGKRIVSVGTTTTRVLETITTEHNLLNSNMLSGETKIYMYPPYQFRFVDALITNFHLPHSTLLALVSAFVSKPNTQHEFVSFLESVAGKAYLEAIENNYRFYSFGDGMMIG